MQGAPLTEASPPGDTVRVTSNQDFYAVYYDRRTVGVDGTTWKLEVTGEVKYPLTLTRDDVKALPSMTEMRTLECISNPVGGNLISNAVWKGVPMGELLNRAGLKDGVREIKITAADGYATAIPVALALHPHAFLAYEMNGEPLPDEHGFPLRCLWPGRYGMKQPKWVTRIEAINTHYSGYWERQGWSNEARIKINSQIRMPESGETVAAPTFVIWGTAFSGEEGVSRVEVSVDDGKTWNEATLTRGPTPYVWTEWKYTWQPAASGHANLVVRATDGAGTTQSERGFQLLGGTFPSGTSAIHSVGVNVKK